MIRAGYEAWNRRDFDAVIEVLDPEIVWTFAGGAQFPGTESTYHGHAGVRQFWETFIEPWDEIHIAVEEMVAQGDLVLAFVRFQARGRGSGLELDVPFAHVYSIRDGKATRFEAFSDPSEARAAAGFD